MSQEKKTTLEEAAENIYKTPFGTRAEDFIAGAEWQRQRTPMPEDTVIFQKGIEEGNRQGREEMFEELRKISATGVVICECSAPEKQQKED